MVAYKSPGTVFFDVLYPYSEDSLIKLFQPILVLIIYTLDIYTRYGYSILMIRNFKDKETEKIYNQVIIIKENRYG